MHGIAEDYVRQSGAMGLADASARWRRAPMNDAQAGLLRRLGITPPEGASKGEASDLITVARGAAPPHLEQHRHPKLGRLITPRHRCRLADTLAAGYPVAADNDCFQGLDAPRVCAMLEAVMPWPSVGARIRRAWPSVESASSGADGGALRQTPIEDQPLAPAHSNLLWVAVPDVVGDADATLEQFRAWHMWLCHLPLAFVLQDGAERPGRVPWQAPGLAAVFLGGSTRWKLGPEAAGLVRKARRRGLHAHAGRVSTARRIRYAQSIGCTSFDSSRYSRWRELLLDDGLARASQPPQLRLIA